MLKMQALVWANEKLFGSKITPVHSIYHPQYETWRCLGFKFIPVVLAGATVVGI